MAAIEKSTNQVFRRKYFIDGNQVLMSGAKAPKKPRSKAVTEVLAADQVAVSNIPVQLTPEMQKMGDHIRVEVVKEGDRIKKIKISCPCGRTADLDCEYSKP
jgi:predicted GTPase